MKCPICHSELIKYQKVFVNGAWWSRCISGLDHGLLVFPDGTEVDFGTEPDYENIWFNDHGDVSYKSHRFRVLRQELPA